MFFGGMSKTICKGDKILYKQFDNFHKIWKQGQCKRISPDLFIGLWCNGNTQDFGPCIMGSNPVSPTFLSWIINESNEVI